MKDVTSATHVLVSGCSGQGFCCVPPIHAYNLYNTMAIFEFNVVRTTKLVMAMVYKKFSSAINITKEE